MSQRSIDGIIQLKPDNTRLKKELDRLRRISKLYKRAIVSLSTLLLIALATVGAIQIYRHNTVIPDPIPLTVRRSVDFNLYFPDPTKLPAGYVLDKHSISASNEVVIMTVNYGQGNQIIFTEQPLPSNNELQTFYAQRIPLRSEVKTAVGQASISALNNETFVSLPTSKTWIIVTAPSDTNQNRLKRVLLSIASE